MRNVLWLCLALQWIVVRDDVVKPPMLGTYLKAARQGTTVTLSNLHVLTMSDMSSLGVETWIDPDAVESRSVSIWRLRPDLSYEPAEPRLKPEEEGFIHFDVYGFLPGQEADVEALTKEYVAVDREAGVRHRWRIYEIVAGVDLPAFVLATPARTRRDFEDEKIAADALRKNRDLPLHARNTKQLRHVASFEGTIAAPSSAASRRTDSTPAQTKTPHR